MPVGFRTALRDRLPLPLARLYRRAHNATSSLERHGNALYLLEATVKLAASAQIAVHLVSGRHDTALDERLSRLALPSLGHWVGFLRDVSAACASLDPHPFPDLAGVSTLLREKRDDLPAVKAALEAMGTRVEGVEAYGGTKPRLLDLLDRLPAYRNQVLGHGAIRDEAFYRTMADRLLEAAVEVLEKAPLLGGGVLEYVGEVREARDGTPLAELWDLTGPEALRLSPPGGEPMPDGWALHTGRLYLRRGPAHLDLHPLVVTQPAPPDAAVLFLNRSQADRRVEYLDYVTGETSSAPELLEDHRVVLGRLTGTPLDTKRLEELQKRSIDSDAGPAEEELQGTRRFGDFDLMSKLGAGGMGTVYLARQRSLRRLVALKTLPPSLSTDDLAAARFQREIRAMARADHPNVVRVLQSGRTEGTWWFAMEYVEGGDLGRIGASLGHSGERGALSDGAIAEAVSAASKRPEAPATEAQATDGRASETQASDGQALEAPAAATLADVPVAPTTAPPAMTHAGHPYWPRVAEVIRDAATGLQHLHERGVLHRDVKPGNVMLTREEGRAVVMDLGLARLAGEQTMTSPAAVLGTIQYAAPEQLQHHLVKVDERADVYGLGATLYELATGQPPYRAASTEALIAQVLRSEPLPPRKIEKDVPADMDAIIRKAMDRDPDRRYGSMRAFAEDLDRFAKGEPVTARPPGLGHWFRLWVRKHAAVAVTALVALLVIVGGTIWFLQSLAGQRNEARAQRDRAIQAEHDAVEAQHTAVEAGKRAVENERLATHHLADSYLARATDAPSETARLLYAARGIDLVDTPEARGLLLKSTPNVEKPLWSTSRSILGLLCAVYADDGTRLITGGDGIRLWDVATGRRTAWMVEHGGITLDVAVDETRHRVVAADDDGSVRVWDTARPRLVPLVIPGVHEGPVRRVRLVQGGTHVVSGGLDGTLSITEIDGPNGEARILHHVKAHEASVQALCADPAGIWIASGSVDTTVAIWDVRTGEEKRRLEGHERPLTLLHVLPDGERMLSIDGGGLARLWHASTWEESSHWRIEGPRVYSAAVDAAGTRILTGHIDGQVRLSEMHTGKLLDTWQVFEGGVTTIAFAPDARSFLCGSAQQLALQVRTFDEPEPRARLQGHGGQAYGATWVDGGRTVASAGEDGTIQLWDAATARRVGLLSADRREFFSLASTAGGRLLVTGDAGGRVHLWTPKAGTEPVVLGHHSTQVNDVAITASGELAASVDAEGGVALWDVLTRTIRHRLRVTDGPLFAVALSPDGATVAAAGDGRVVHLWRTEDAVSLGSIAGHGDRLWDLAFSPDGALLATACHDELVRVFDVVTQQELRRYEGHAKGVTCVEWNGGGSRLASGAFDGSVRLWAADAPTEVARVEGHEGAVWAIVFAEEGHHLLTAGQDGTLRSWSLEDLPPPPRIKAHASRVYALAFHPDGRQLAVGSTDSDVHVYDLPTGRRALTLPTIHEASTRSLLYADEGRYLVAVLGTGTILVWDAASGELVQKIQWLSDWPNRAVLLPDGRRIAVACESAYRLWDLTTGEEGDPLPTGDKFGLSLATHPAGTILATATTDDARIHLWDLETRASTGLLEGHQDDVWALAWSPEGRALASASLDRTARIWHPLSDGEDLVLEGHERPVTGVAFARGGRWLVTFSSDHSVRAWDLSSGREGARFEAAGHHFDALAVHPDGTWVAAGDDAGMVHFWSLEALEWPRGSCLTRAEEASGFTLTLPFDVVSPQPQRLEMPSPR